MVHRMTQSLLLAGGLALMPALVVAAPATTTELNVKLMEQRQLMVETSASKLAAVRSALTAYYFENSAWPLSLGLLTTSGHYVGDLTTPLGPISGAAVGSNYGLAVSIPTGDLQGALLKSLAAAVGGTVSGSTVQLPVQSPGALAVTKGMLSRKADAANPDNNVMYQNINLNSFSLDNVGTLNGNAVDVTTVDTQDLTASRDGSFARNVAVGQTLTTVDANVSGTVTAATSVITGNESVGGDLTVTGVINGSSATLGSATVTNDLTVGRDVVARNLSLTGNLTMQPGSTLNAGNGRLQSLVVSGTSTLNNLTVSNDMSIGGQLTAGGLVSNGNAHIKGNALVDGDLTVVGLSTMSGVRVGGAQVIGADGTLYQGGIKISDLFLGKNAKAADSDLLDGIDSSSFARRDAPNTFAGTNIFNSRTDLNGGTYAGNKMVISGDGNTLYEGGVSLSTKYLGKNDKATDADRLDGIDSNLFARRDTANIFTGTNTFNGRTDLNGGTYAGGKLVISADGNVLYEAGQALSARYLGINAKAKDADLLDGLDSTYYLNASNLNAGTLGRARLSGTYDISITGSAANADLLDGIDSSSFARRDAPNTFTSANTFNGTVTTAGLLDVNNGIDVSGAATFRNGQTITGNVSIAGSLTAGAATFTGLTVNGTLTANAVNSLGDVTSRSGGTTYSLNSVGANIASLSATVASLDAWRTACKRNASDPGCGIPFSGGGGSTTTTTVQSNSVNVGSPTGTTSLPLTAGTYVEATLAYTNGGCGDTKTFTGTAAGTSITLTGSMRTCSASSLTMTITITGSNFTVSGGAGQVGAKKITFTR